MKNWFLTECENLFLNRSDIENLIDLWIFSERDRMILKRKLLDGLSFEAVAEEYDYSVLAIKKIVYRGEIRLSSVIERTIKNSRKKKRKN